MWVFALLAAGFGSSAQTESKDQELVSAPREKTAIEQELIPPPTGGTPKHFFDKRFEKSPSTRGFMVVIPQLHVRQFAEQTKGNPRLEPPGGWVTPEGKRYRVEP
ncbi:hypothetical protein [Aquidulcibacter sp.]|uniref:hypothetical protein n=1 Tax=Aquidulcibacter sp. TaxID=2052990 RepID=UPI0025BBD18B|nr:hypothetical protein [Aquidulcibacter sp.]MCA3696709.1 hypothetical protein [Aquidulcibacter sp.]